MRERPTDGGRPETQRADNQRRKVEGSNGRAVEWRNSNCFKRGIGQSEVDVGNGGKKEENKPVHALMNPTLKSIINLHHLGQYIIS